MCIAPDASWVAVSNPKPNPRVRVWDGATGRERFSRDFEANAFCMASTPDGRLLAIEISDLGRGTKNKVEFVDAETGELKFSLPTRRRQVTAISFSTDGKRMAVGFNGAVQIWDVAERRLERTIEGFERVVTRLKFAPDDRLIAAGTQDGQVWIWTETGQRTQVIDTGTRGIRAIAFSPDGRLLVTATNKAPVALWDVIPAPARQPPEPDV
jgi:WD40 repeat protein